MAAGLVMVGDSAGQSNPLVLEGIRYAIEFGRLAGGVGARSLGRNSTKESLLDYEKTWKAKVESKIQSALKVQTRWLGLTDEQMRVRPRGGRLVLRGLVRRALAIP